MNVLFLNNYFDTSDEWLERLRSAGANVTVVTEDDDWTTADQVDDFAMAICYLPRNDTPPKIILALLRNYSSCVVAITGEHNPIHHHLAYESGFDDCIDSDCDPLELSGMLEHAEQERQVNARLQQSQKLTAIGELAAGIAHEINTPIQYVGDNARFFREAYEDITKVLDTCQKIVHSLESGENPAVDVVKLRESINQSELSYLQSEIPSALGQTIDGIERVSTIVRAMKEFAHPGSSSPAPVNLPQAIETTLTLARNEWKYDSVIEKDFDSSLPDVPCYSGELNQVLLNLIVNAAQAISACRANGGNSTTQSTSQSDIPERGTIRIQTRRLEDSAQIVISDDGTGIQPEHISRIFKPFFTTKAAGKGTGQGLAIAHEVIVGKLNGSIDVESHWGVGTTFTITLPLAIEQEPQSFEMVQGGQS